MNPPWAYAALALHRPSPRATIVPEAEREARTSMRGLEGGRSTRVFDGGFAPRTLVFVELLPCPETYGLSYH